MKDRSLPPHLLDVERNLHALARQRLLYTLIGIGAAVAVLASGVIVAEEQNAGSFRRGIRNFFDYPVDLVREALAAGWAFWPILLGYVPDLLTTINMALFSTVIAFVIAAGMAFFASRNAVDNPFVIQTTRRVFDACRSFPELVIALILLYLMGQSPLPAVIAVTIHTIGALGKQFSEAVENCDRKPLEGLESVGANWVQRVRFGLLTQALPLFLSYGLLRLEINVRASTILGFVGAGGIGEALNTTIQWRHGADVCAIIVLLVTTISLVDRLSDTVRHQMIGRVS
jgi:phosphonate transport system permease protein